MALSQGRSATIRLSLLFSSSSGRSRFISDGIRPAYFLRQSQNVASSRQRFLNSRTPLERITASLRQMAGADSLEDASATSSDLKYGSEYGPSNRQLQEVLNIVCCAIMAW